MRIGTIGSGFIVKSFIEAAREVTGVSFTAVYSRSLIRAQEFATEMGITTVYDSLDNLFSDDSVDVVYIASPNSLHPEQAILAMKAGKHVIVEKPFAGTLAKAKEMVDVARENKVMLFEAICNIHMPHYHYIRENLHEIGKPRIVQCNFSQYSSRYDQLLAGEVTNVFDPKFSGGALADINIYNIHFVVGLFGMPQSTRYIANQHENGIDTSGIVTLTYPDFVVECVGAKDSVSVNNVQIQGEKGYIYVPSGSSQLKSVTLVTKNGSQEHHVQDKSYLYYQVEVFKDIFDSHDFDRRDALLDHSLKVVAVAEAARDSIDLKFES